MMVPAWTLFALTAVFLIRELHKNYPEKKKAKLIYKYFGNTQSNEYQNGYFYAYKEMADIWNSDIKSGNSQESRLYNIGLSILKGLNHKWK